MIQLNRDFKRSGVQVVCISWNIPEISEDIHFKFAFKFLQNELTLFSINFSIP